MVGLIRVGRIGKLGGIADAADGGSVSAAAAFLASYGPHGMVMDFSDASIAIDDAADLLDFTSSGQVSGGALVGPGAKTSYPAPSPKLTEQADGLIKFQAHNLYLNSAAPANQSIAVLSGATYAVTITGSVSMVASGAATGTWSAGTTTFTAATATLTLGSTSGSGTVHLRRTPSVDTYIETTTAAAYDLPYVHSGGVRQSIVPELAATNSQLNSINFSAWSLSNLLAFGSGSQSDATTAPDGTMTADLVTPNTTLGSHRVFGSGALASTQTATYSIYAKPNGYTQLGVRENQSTGSSIGFNLTGLGSVTVGHTAGGASISNAVAVPLANGWWRCSVTVSLATPGTHTVAWCILNGSYTTGDLNGSGSYAGDGTSGMYLWGAQIETGTVATSPIITYGAAVARAADSPQALLSLFPSIGTAYTLYAKYKPQSASVATTAIRLDDTTANELVSLGNNTSGAGLATVTDGGAAQAAITSGTITSAAFHRVAASVEANNVRLVVNGGAEVQDATVTLPTLTRLLIGSGGGMELVQLAILPGARTEAQLQALGA